MGKTPFNNCQGQYNNEKTNTYQQIDGPQLCENEM